MILDKKNIFPAFAAFGLLLFFMSCKTNPTSAIEPLFVKQTNAGVQFTNSIQNSEDFNIFSYRNFYNGGGVAIGDVNNDGMPDVYFTANMGSNKLYLNKGNWQFEDITEKANVASADKWSTGVVMVDLNGDSLLDIYVCNAGFQKGIAQENQLYINKGDGSFIEKAHAFGLADAGYTTHAAFFDYDMDGDLDCYMLNNSFIPVNTLNYSNKRDLRAKDWPIAEFLKGGGDKLLRNDEGYFTDVSEKAGIYGSLIGFGLGVTVGDINGDRYPDIYVSNDFFERDYLYINQQNGTYSEELEKYIGHTSMSSMGADMADINNDGYPDLFVTDMLPGDDYRLKTTSSFENFNTQQLKEQRGFYHQYMQNTLQLNDRNGGFDEIAQYAGVAGSDWSWGGLIFDADNDGWSDLYVCNGIYQDVTDQDFIDFFANDIIQKMVMTGAKEDVDQVISKMPSRPIPNKAFRNKGNLRFDDMGMEWGFDEKTFSNGAAYGDLDGDGDLDLVINNVNQPALIYRNQSIEQGKGHYIGFTLQGPPPNTKAIGACIRVFQQERITNRELIPTRGFQSSCDYTINIGLNGMPVDSVEIIWPNGRITTLTKPVFDSLYAYSQPDTGRMFVQEINSLQTLLKIKPTDFPAHVEDDYLDFYSERNIPKSLTDEGPALAVADVNGDGRNDFYIGGALHQAGQLYLSTPNGFQLSPQPAFAMHAEFEDVSALFLDVNGDGFHDLLVGSGGNFIEAYNPELQSRIYINDGKGNFSLLPGALPITQGNASAVSAQDWDNDGDLDIFMGNRCVPRQYGANPVHYFLENDGTGKFKNITDQLAPGFSASGMITNAVWANVLGDDKKELIVAGDWMAPSIWSFEKSILKKVSSNLSNQTGWWLTVKCEDLDGDGKKDLILGNQGENFYLHPTPENPNKLWIGDFDNNGISDKILTRSLNQRDMPVFLKRELTDQLPQLKKQNLRHEAFANKSLQELMGKDILKNIQMNEVKVGASMIAWNEGNGNFTMQALPQPVQFSTVHSICISDINGDGKPDLLMGGNDYFYLPQFSRQDASKGHVILNRGNRKMEWIEPKKSGLYLNGAIRYIEPLDHSNWIIAINNKAPAIITKNDQKQGKK